jgi:hypothetical protein
MLMLASATWPDVAMTAVTLLFWIFFLKWLLQD